MSPHKYPIYPQTKLNDTALIHIQSANGNPFNARFLMDGRNFMRFGQTYNGKSYFIRVYPNEQMIHLEVTINETILIKIKSQVIEETTLIDNLFVGDYIEAGKMNCYVSESAGDLKVISYVMNFGVYIGEGCMDNCEFVYESKDFIVKAEDVGYSAAIIPIPKENTIDKRRIYFCLETNNSGFAYFLKFIEHKPIMIEPGQSVKIYLNANEKHLTAYSEVMQSKPPLTISFNRTEGCFNLLIKHRQSSYYGQLIAKNISEGISQFNLLKEDDLTIGDTMKVKLLPMQTPLIRNIKPPNKDTLCTGSDVYTECPTYFILETCKDVRSETHFMLERSNEPLIIPGEEFLLLVMGRTEKIFIIPDIAPNIEILRINIKQRTSLIPTIIGKITIIQKRTGKIIVEDITGKNEILTMEFKKKADASLEGDYLMTIEGFQNVNIKLHMTMYANINNNLTQVFNPRLHLREDSIPLKDYRIGYFSYYAKDDKETEVAIVVEPKVNIRDVKVFTSTYTWGSKANDSNILRLPRNGSYHYLTVEGEYKGYKDARVTFTFLESQRFDDLLIGLHYSFQGTRLFHLKVEKEKEYIIKKEGDTLETIYLSIDSANKIPLADNKTQEFPAKKGLQEIVIKNASEVYFTVFCHSSNCYYHIHISEISITKTDL